MPRVVDPRNLDHAVQLYISGESIEQSATHAGIGEPTVSKELHRRGVELHRTLIAKRIEVPENEIVQQYASGTSEYAIARQLGVSRDVITRVLRENGVKRRGRSDAGIVRASKMTAAQRADQAAAAHAATRGRVATVAERCRYAKSRERRPPKPSIYESQFAEWLAERDIPYRREVAVGPYNIDFAVGPVAVEILGGGWHAYKPLHARRTPYILNQGWAMVFVWATVNHPMTAAAADYVHSTANLTSRDPALIGQYRVIRGDAHVITGGSAHDHEFALIAPTDDC